MALTCPNCGNSNEPDSKFCAQCGYALPLSAKEAARVDYGPIEPTEPRDKSSKVVFVSPSRSQPYPYTPPSQRPSTGSFWALLFFCFILALFILIPLFFMLIFVPIGGPWHGIGTTMGDFGATMGDFGGAIGTFFGELGSRLGTFFGSLGSGIGEFFGSIFSGFDHFTVVGVLFRVLFGFFVLFVIIAIISAIFRSARGHCSSR